MATYTDNYGLKKPEGTDIYNIEDFNGNADAIDAALQALEDSKQDNLTFDETPTEGSDKPVTSGGVFAKYNKSIIVENNKTVEAGAWAQDSTFADFPFAAEVAIVGATAEHVPDVTFNPGDILSGKFAPVAQSGEGTVKIFAKEVPEASIVILSIVLRKEI